MLVRMYAHNYPDEVLGMVLVDSLHEEPAIRTPALTKANQGAAGQFRMLALLSSTGIMALAPQYIPNPGLPADAYAQLQATTATSGIFETFLAEFNAGEESRAEARALHITDFGDMPLIVLSQGLSEAFPQLSDAENQQAREEWQGMQSRLVALSSNSRQIIAEQSGHFIQRDQPDLVIDAIRQIMEAVQ
jgi:pimeloyl-ACP methyl ester carboxylesterase